MSLSHPHRIAYCIDEGYLLPLAVSLRSVLENWEGPRDLEVIVVHTALPVGSKEKIAAALPPSPLFRLRWVPLDTALVHGLPAVLHLSVATYFRIFLPELLPDLSKVLYLDADVIARADLAPLLELFDPAFPLQACQDQIGFVGNPLAQLPRAAAFGVSEHSTLFNTGVMLMNLDAWRAERLSEKVLSLGRAHPELFSIGDQNPINVALYGRIGRLPPEWNAQIPHPNVTNKIWDCPYVAQDHAGAKIVHYTTEWKPWSIGRQMPVAAYFHEVRARTAWSEAP